MKYDSETPLEDDYPVYGGYWYLADGVPRQCSFNFAFVRDLKRIWEVAEIRNCDLKARGMMNQATIAPEQTEE